MFGCSARGLVVGVAAAEYCATNLRSRLLRLPLATASTTIRSRGGAVVHVHQGKRFTSSAGPGPAQPPVSTHWTGSTLDDESRSVPENAVYFVLAYPCCTASACGASFFFFFFFFPFPFHFSFFFFFFFPSSLLFSTSSVAALRTRASVELLSQVCEKQGRRIYSYKSYQSYITAPFTIVHNLTILASPSRMTRTIARIDCAPNDGVQTRMDAWSRVER